MLNFPDDRHEFVCGMTQSGKTTYAINRGKKFNGAVLFFNPQLTNNPFTIADGSTSSNVLIDYLSCGGKIDLRPTLDDRVAKKILNYLVDKVFEACQQGKIKKILFIADECHIYARSGVAYNPLEKIATRGLSQGFYGLFITQRPALTSNTLLTQSDIKTFFATEWETKYLNNYGVNAEEIAKRIKQKGEHSYCKIYKGEIFGAFKD